VALFFNKQKQQIHQRRGKVENIEKKAMKFPFLKPCLIPFPQFQPFAAQKVFRTPSAFFCHGTLLFVLLTELQSRPSACGKYFSIFMFRSLRASELL